jgi:hypothetical protein
MQRVGWVKPTGNTHAGGGLRPPYVNTFPIHDSRNLVNRRDAERAEKNQYNLTTDKRTSIRQETNLHPSSFIPHPSSFVRWAPARRPANSRLDNSKLVQTFGLTPPSWEAMLTACIQDMQAETGNRK